MARIYIETLSKEAAKNIQERAYDSDQLEQVYQEVLRRQRLKRKGFMRAAIMAMVISILMPLLTIMAAAKQPNMDPNVILFSSVVTIAAVALILVLVKVLAVDRMMNQFLHALKVGYPEKMEQYGRDSFRFGD